MVSVITQCILIAGMPFIDHFDNGMTLFIEFSVSIYLYLALSLEDLRDDDANIREQTGWAMAVVIITVVAVSVLRLLHKITLYARLLLKRWLN